MHVISFTDMGLLGGTTNTKGIQAPSATLANEAENAAKVIRKDGISEPRAINEACSLKDLLVLIINLLLAFRVRQGVILWILPGVTLIDLKQFVCDVLDVKIIEGGDIDGRPRTYVVIAIKQHEQNTDSRWK